MLNQSGIALVGTSHDVIYVMLTPSRAEPYRSIFTVMVSPLLQIVFVVISQRRPERLAFARSAFGLPNL
ncbi:hypothetical protein [Bradyrhizobium genosp. A]|uniref:hypothetical protein n=1 Tax=Bradyrhizobium genosp. A TaxID=83626 RepID=UPI003CEDE26A